MKIDVTPSILSRPAIIIYIALLFTVSHYEDKGTHRGTQLLSDQMGILSSSPVVTGSGKVVIVGLGIPRLEYVCAIKSKSHDDVLVDETPVECPPGVYYSRGLLFNTRFFSCCT